MLKLLYRAKVAAEDVGMNGSKVVFAFLKLACTDGNELISGEGLGNVWHKECSKCDVKGEDRFNTVSHVEGGVASRLASGSMVSPKDVWQNSRPLGDISSTGFDKRLSDCAVLAFNNTIGT